jgi:uncharacterized protein (TIRG00374 family)
MLVTLRRGYKLLAARRWVRVLLQALVSVALLVLLVIAAQRTAVVESLRELQPGALLLAAGLYGVSCVFASARWQLLLNHVGIRERLGNLTGLYFIGQFFSLFLPTSAGGDVARIYDVARRSHRPAEAILATFQERLLGLGAFSLIGLGAALYHLPLIPAELRPWVVLCQTAVVAVVALALYPALPLAVVSRAAERMPVFRAVLRRCLGHRLGVRLVNVLRPMAELPVMSPLLIVSVVGLAGVAASLNIGIYYVVGEALRIEAGFLAYCLVVPLVAVVRMFPLSLNGIGVSEGSFVILIGIFGVPTDKALALALAMLGLTTGMALTGGLVLAFRLARGTWNAGRSPSPKAPDAAPYAQAQELLERPLPVAERVI